MRMRARALGTARSDRIPGDADFDHVAYDFRARHTIPVGCGISSIIGARSRNYGLRRWRCWVSVCQFSKRDGPRRSLGYFRSTCSDGPCADPFGQQQLTMALLFAHGRWGSHSGAFDFGAEALRSLAARRDAARGGGTTSLFAASSQLVVDEPSGQRAQLTRPSNVMPGYYALWAEATADAGLARDSRSLAAFSQGSRAPDDGTLPLRALRWHGGAGLRRLRAGGLPRAAEHDAGPRIYRPGTVVLGRS